MTTATLLTILGAWTANSVVFLALGASLVYRKSRREAPITLGDVNPRNLLRALTGKEPTQQQQDIIDGTAKKEYEKYSAARMPGGSPRKHPFDEKAREVRDGAPIES